MGGWCWRGVESLNWDRLKSCAYHVYTPTHTHTHTHPIFIAYSLLLTARERFKEYFSIPGATQENLELNRFLPLSHIKNIKMTFWTDLASPVLE